ncbi:MAG: pepsin/retropepsin-like aspartic protease family protein [Pyrinomonadaceae bacterium]
MKTFAITLLGSLFALSVVSASAQASLETLLKDRQYFDLRDAVAKRSKESSAESLYYRGVVANRFNQPAESTTLLEQYVRRAGAPNARQAYELLADNYLRMYQYGKAADIYRLLMGLKKHLTTDEFADYQNSFGLWNALRDTPPQTVVLTGDSKIQGTRDKANLLNLPVQVNGQNEDFVFDTGANLSTITVSTANKLGLKLIESGVSVGTSSDIKVTSKLAVAPELKLGSVVVTNVVFLVLDDQALYFPQINYQIDGIIGFPVMEGIGRVSIARSNEVLLIATTAKTKAEPNMCFENLKPLVQGVVKGRKMIFLLDSGAVSSAFYPRFFEANKQRVLDSGPPQKVKVGGAGGSKLVEAYYLKDLEISIAGKTARFAKAQVISESINEDSSNFYGNLGQDLIKQFDRTTLDFRAMRIEFE